jgi:type VI secretion system protein ImpK
MGMGATLFGATSHSAPQPEQPSRRRRDNLALVYQNAFTVIVRLRAKRQSIADAKSFRTQFQGALRQAEKEGLAKLYPQDDVRLATFAVVAFLDETILSSIDPVFSDWARLPLQEEMFGHAQAGEVFFQHVEQLLRRGDSHATADLLEIFSLCILLGYQGKYGFGQHGSVRSILDSIAERIRRIRGPLSGFSPSWAIPEGSVPIVVSDPTLKRFAIAALVSALTAAILFFSYRMLLAHPLPISAALLFSLKFPES